LNGELPNRIISGGVIVKANVAEFTETGASFENGTTIDNLDAVVIATGYIFGFPFIDKSVIEVKSNKINLYKYIFLPDLQKHTMAIMGCFQPLGAIMPMSEMQCHLATRVFKVIIVVFFCFFFVLFFIDLGRFLRYFISVSYRYFYYKPVSYLQL
jgi:dimethylaniline monooxygenase (N-oxide forming)